MILGILQARTSSSRLPNKVLMPILGEPMLARQIERLTRCNMIDILIVATSDQPADLPIATLCQRLAIPCFRGPLDDVLHRFYLASLPYQPSHIVRLTGDCPLADPTLIDALITLHLTGHYDYSNNCTEPTYPDGLDAEIMTNKTLHTLQRDATTSLEREHVTYYIHRHPDQFTTGLLRQQENLAHLRWTVDERADFDLIEQIYGALYPTNPAFSSADILQLLTQQPELLTINGHYQRNAGLGATD